MRIGIQMRNFVTDQLIKNFDTHEERSTVFYSLMVNYIANSLADISDADRLDQNLEEVIQGLRDWVKGTQSTIVKFNRLKSVLKKEDLH